MSVYKRGQTWWVSFTAPNGEPIRKSAKTTVKREAQEYHDRLKSEYWRIQKLGDKPRRTWQEAVVRWIEESEKSKQAQENDLTYLRYADQFLSGKYLDEITRDDLDEITRAKRIEGVSNSTINRYLETIRAILNKAMKDWDWITSVPSVKILKEPKVRIRWLKRHEADRLISELPFHLQQMCIFSLATGLRQSNVVGLEWEQVHLDRRIAWIHPDQAKSKKAIGVPLNDEAVTVIRNQIGNHNTYVFTYKGNPVQRGNTRAFKLALKRAGIENFRWHDLRHTWASWHVQNGTPLHILQELGGWSDFAMVKRYAHLAPEHLAEFANNVTATKAKTLELVRNTK